MLLQTPIRFSNISTKSVAGMLTSNVSTPKMLGLAGTITPKFSGKVLITMTWDQNTDSGGFVNSCTIKVGTGTAPVNGASPTGTSIGRMRLSVIPYISSMCFVATGLILNTAYWIDLSIQADDGLGGNGNISNIDIVAIEQ